MSWLDPAWALWVGFWVYTAAGASTLPTWWLAVTLSALGFGGAGYALAVGLVGWGLAHLREAARKAHRRREAYAWADLFLRRLYHLLRIHPFPVALEEAMRGLAEIPEVRPEQAVQALSKRFPIPPLAFLARVVPHLLRHGGEGRAVVAGVVRRLEAERRREERRRVQEAGKRATILSLSVAPLLVVPAFRMLEPAFYQTLTQTLPGTLALSWVGLSTAAVLGWLARQTVGEATAQQSRSPRPSAGASDKGRELGRPLEGGAGDAWQL